MFRKNIFEEIANATGVLFMIVLIAVVVTLVRIGITTYNKNKEEVKLKNNTACQQQYNQKAYWKQIRHDRYSKEIDYCVLENGELRILRKPE